MRSDRESDISSLARSARPSIPGTSFDGTIKQKAASCPTNKMSCAFTMFDPDAYPELGAWALLALEQQQLQREQQLCQERHRSEPPPRAVLEKRILNREEDAALPVDVGNCQHVEKRARM